MVANLYAVSLSDVRSEGDPAADPEGTGGMTLRGSLQFEVAHGLSRVLILGSA